MPRNGSGTFTLAQPPFVPNTPISSASVNSDLDDIATGLTGSVARDGQSPMSAVLQLANTGFTYASDPNTGMYRSGADAQSIQCGGVDVLLATSTGVDFPLTATVAGQPLFPAGITAHTAAATAPPGWLVRDGSAVSRLTYTALFAAIGTLYGSGDGSTTFNLPDARGRVDAGIDGGTNRLTGINLGTIGGVQSRFIGVADLPNVSPTFSGITGSVTVISTVSVPQNPTYRTPDGNNYAVLYSGTIAPIQSNGTFTPQGTVSSINGGVTQTIFGTVQPTMGLTPIIKT